MQLNDLKKQPEKMLVQIPNQQNMIYHQDRQI